MALIQEFTDVSGNVCPQSYWRATSIYIDSASSSIRVSFVGWKDSDAFQTRLSPLYGAVKHYSITGQEFMDLATSAPVGSILYDVLANASETYALAKQDTPVDGVLVSFFEGATQV